MAYTHFGARLARLDRFDSCTLHHLIEGTTTLRCCALANCSRDPALALARRLYEGSATLRCDALANCSRDPTLALAHPVFRAGSSTDENSWPTTNRCGFDSRTAHQGRISSKVEPAIDNREVLVRFQHPAPFIRGLRGKPLRPRDSSRPTALTVAHPVLYEGSAVNRSALANRSRDPGLALAHLRLRVTGRDGRCTRLLSETRLVRSQRHPPFSRGRFIQQDQDRAF